MTAATPGPPPRDHHDGQATPGQAAYLGYAASESAWPAWECMEAWQHRKWERAAQRGHEAIAAQQPQPAPELADATARSDRLEGQLEDVRALLDHETRIIWDTGLPGERARIAPVREQAGLEALT